MEYYEPRDNVSDRIEEEVNLWETNSQIQNFFSGKSVFITGATGLIGSLIVENILRACPRVEKIYLLMRSKKEKSMEERLDNLFQCEVFWKVNKMHKNPKEKVQIISGDITLPMCGISESDRQLLIDNVDIVYHVAAGLRMDEMLRTAYHMNVRATEDLLELGTRMKHLKAFIYVSTAYSNTFLIDIHEQVYEPLYSSEQIKTLISLLGDPEIAAMTPKLVGMYKNTYAFTKAIAEDVTKSYSRKIPVAVVRPSIVIGCEKEPLVSWINNIYGATGVSLAASLGIMRVWYGSNEKIADIIPADKVVSAIVAISWHIGQNHLSIKNLETQVYNIVSSSKSPQTWRDYMVYTEYYARYFEVISTKFIRTYDFYIEEKYWVYTVKLWFYHLLFGIVIDQIMKFKGKPPMLVRGFVKIYNFNMQLAGYSSNEWIYHQPNMDALWSKMSAVDKKIFNFDMTNFDWKKYHSRTIKSIVVYILKEDFSLLEESKKRYQRLSNFMLGLKISSYAVLTYFMRSYIFGVYNALDTLVI